MTDRERTLGGAVGRRRPTVRVRGVEDTGPFPGRHASHVEIQAETPIFLALTVSGWRSRQHEPAVRQAPARRERPADELDEFRRDPLTAPIPVQAYSTLTPPAVPLPVAAVPAASLPVGAAPAYAAAASADPTFASMAAGSRAAAPGHAASGPAAYSSPARPGSAMRPTAPAPIPGAAELAVPDFPPAPPESAGRWVPLYQAHVPAYAPATPAYTKLTDTGPHAMPELRSGRHHHRRAGY